jgi:PAS domain S-box-containing protein
VEDSPGLICRFREDGSITFINDAYCEYFGKDREELVGLSFYTMIPEEDRDALAAAIAALSPEHPIRQQEHRVIGPDGQIRWQRWANRAIFDDEGRPVAYQAFGEDITDRKQAEEQIRGYESRLRALASALTVAEERERHRIASDLHDHIGHSLALARMELDGITDSTPTTEMIGLVKDVSGILLKASQDTRNLIHELRSPSMEHLGLGAAVSEWLEDYAGRRHGLDTEFIDRTEDLRLDDDLRTILFRSVRELLTNVIKHAKADRVSVLLESSAGGFKIAVKDDGVGFDVRTASRASRRKGGFGLFSIEERMTNLGGSLEIVSEPGKGCEVIMSVPLGLRGGEQGV